MRSLKAFAILSPGAVLTICLVLGQGQLALSQQSLPPTGPLATVDLHSNTSAPDPTLKKAGGEKGGEEAEPCHCQ
jgi:hypothetical protein